MRAVLAPGWSLDVPQGTGGDSTDTRRAAVMRRAGMTGGLQRHRKPLSAGLFALVAVAVAASVSSCGASEGLPSAHRSVGNGAILFSGVRGGMAINPNGSGLIKLRYPGLISPDGTKVIVGQTDIVNLDGSGRRKSIPRRRGVRPCLVSRRAKHRLSSGPRGCIPALSVRPADRQEDPADRLDPTTARPRGLRTGGGLRSSARPACTS